MKIQYKEKPTQSLVFTTTQHMIFRDQDSFQTNFGSSSRTVRQTEPFFFRFNSLARNETLSTPRVRVPNSFSVQPFVQSHTISNVNWSLMKNNEFDLQWCGVEQAMTQCKKQSFLICCIALKKNKDWESCWTKKNLVIMSNLTLRLFCFNLNIAGMFNSVYCKFIWLKRRQVWTKKNGPKNWDQEIAALQDIASLFPFNDN